jgi:hypothetical protein
LAAEDAHRDALWVLTVVGGLSIVKAIDSLESISFSEWTIQNGIILCRFFVFLLTAVRFYIGSNVFFQAVHIEAGHETKFPSRNYVLDFGSAIFHFSILYALASAITVIPHSPARLSDEHFFLALCFMLLYDWAWYLASTSYDTAQSIQKWAWYNTLAVFLPCGAIFFGLQRGVVDRTWFEVLIAIWISISSLPDLIRMAHGKMP